MAGRTIQVRVGGQNYRLVTSASEEEILRLATIVDEKLSAVVPPGRPMTPQSLLLAAMALAHDLEEARTKADATAVRAKEAFGRILKRVDAALESGRPAEHPSSGGG